MTRLPTEPNITRNQTDPGALILELFKAFEAHDRKGVERAEDKLFELPGGASRLNSCAPTYTMLLFVHAQSMRDCHKDMPRRCFYWLGV